ncbi:ATP-binding cassette, subfamily B, multidrug efflux pump [Pseudoxanthobacter soli DSM 19599]|uniref:ATP-binding cassette, subfamily B, multidrug efflux pump n=1 Tax=Pseudoxanthobacter soli DSM 19599 TaxID=1123029 RepID=A0A1M7ZDZ5_9HYPH|nr:ABC transporter ATP-binding protein [Pseudoxanthobacter soli]SHO63094.1 ATP-binding cassette, subfamily B, multidrug efflux pump [Pseudoxanthobacter soli DSM 19599]
MINRLLSWFEGRIDPFAAGSGGQPPAGLMAFYWYFVRQAWVWFAMVLLAGALVAIVEVAMFRYVGSIVDLLGTTTPEKVFQEHGETLLWMLAVVLFARPFATVFHDLVVRQAILPPFTNLIRWQSHRHVVRQSMAFFQNDFAGRIASRVMQTGSSLRASVVETVDALWFAGLYAASALVLFADADIWLAMPLFLWVIGYILLLRHFVPKLRDLARVLSERNSLLTGRIVDGYTNIMTVKLFAHAEREDAYVREAMGEHVSAFRKQLRSVTAMTVSVNVLNCLMLGATGAVAVLLWQAGVVGLGAIAFTTGLAIRIVNMSGWIMWEVTGIFENVGQVQEGMMTIAQPLTVVDRPNAPKLDVPRGEVRFENITFHYGRSEGIIERLSLTVKPGERIGLVGRSGAGKSTLVSLLLRFYDLEGGRIVIDGQDVADVSQESLRAAIGVVTQDTSLLHRSVADNILYGRPDAAPEAVEAAAERAHATAFIGDLVDPKGRRGYEAHVGERGVKLSGGQRQRIAIARVLLKDAPILILDEATSALDSEVEAAIQDDLDALMEGKTVIAIAHRLSTIARMDRLIVLDGGAIVEDGSHEELIARGGLYADLWRRQSGGFIAHEGGNADGEAESGRSGPVLMSGRA